MSTLSWLDHSEAQKRAMLETIELFRERDTLDELGLGAIRDGFANLLFPGTSVLHTRARYLLLIPWIYQALERRRVSSADVARRAREDQSRLAVALTRGGEGDHGVIGRRAGASLKQLPASMYWTAYGQFGIRNFPGTPAQYHRSLDAYYRRLSLRPPLEDDGDQPDTNVAPNWHTGMPSAPEAFLENTTFALTTDEAIYLRDRIVETGSGSLLAHLLSAGRLHELPRHWDAVNPNDLPAALGTIADASQRFAISVHGAQLLYNLMLAEDSGREDWIELHLERFERWDATGRLPDVSALWHVVGLATSRITHPTKTFVENWIAIVSQGPSAIDRDEAKRIVRLRERQVKRSQARLWNRAALDHWDGLSARGTAPFEFRWSTVRAVIEDIRVGLARA